MIQGAPLMKKSLVLIALFFTYSAHAEELSHEKTQEIIKSMQAFDKDCKDFAKKRVVGNVDVVNKTSSHIDTADMEKFVGEHLDIEVEPGSPRELVGTLSSSSSSNGKVTKEVFKMNLVLKEKQAVVITKKAGDSAHASSSGGETKELCNKTYQSVFEVKN